MKVKVKPVYNTPVEDIPITTEFIKLDSFLKLCNAAETGGMAKTLIQEEQVKVSGITCVQRGKKLRPGAVVTVGGHGYRVVRADS